MSTTSSEVVTRNLDRYINELCEILEQPSVSSTGEGIDECADKVASLLSNYGVKSEVLQTDRSPIVYGERIVDQNAPTILFYGHYDVQPPGREELWDSPPFEPEIRESAVGDEVIFARGSGDNKGQFTSHIFALEVLKESTANLSVNVKYLIEGEEENGSIGLPEFLKKERKRLECDFVYVSDGPTHNSGNPTIFYGNRGLLAMEATITKANTDVHSGNFGGPIPNAANELIEALNTMYNGTEPLDKCLSEDINITEGYKQMASEVPVDHSQLKEELGLSELALDEEESYYERLTLNPAFSINGLEAGYQGDRMKTIIPHTATAKFDFRLLPGQDTSRMFDKIREHLIEVNEDIEVIKLSTFPPMITDPDTPYANIIRKVLSSVWDQEVIEIPMLGGSLPAGYLQDSLKVPVLVIPYANPDQNNHAPNEHLAVRNFRNGIQTTADFLNNVKDSS